ncbi:MAG TPA: class I SAM-dependent methyltransferase [Thermohalobaculum sp.]|nr:class I SAM-dependent methyltransferase [Thermohalobaculum sp.]
MDDKLQRRVQRYGWDAAAPVYDCAWSKNLRPAHSALLDMVALQPGMRVLETACGTGLLTLRVADLIAPGGSLLATDISGEMIAETATRAASVGLGNVKTARMGGEELDVDDGVFDAALCALGLMYVPNPIKALAEIRRTVKPGGRVAVALWGERRNCGWAEIFPIVDAQVKSEVCPLFFSLGVPGALGAAMASAGLRKVDERRHTAVLEFPSEGSLLSAQIDAGAVALAAKRFSPDTRREVETAFLASVSEYRRNDGSYGIPGEFVTAVATH